MLSPRLHEFFRFCLVGASGFIADAGILELLIHAGVPTLIARIFSILAALQITYLLHAMFTFRQHRGMNVKSWLRFLGTNGIGAAINYAVFFAVLTFVFGSDTTLTHQLSLAAGTAVALGFNYWATRQFVFRRVV